MKVWISCKTLARNADLFDTIQTEPAHHLVSIDWLRNKVLSDTKKNAIGLNDSHAWSRIVSPAR